MRIDSKDSMRAIVVVVGIFILFILLVVIAG